MSDEPNISNAAKHEAKFTLPKIEPPKVKSLLEQMHEQWVLLAQKDGRLGAALNQRREAQFTLKKAETSIRLRLKFLQRKAVEKIQRRNGIRIIPGFTMGDGSHKTEIARMTNQLRLLAHNHGFELPADFNPDAPPTLELNDVIELSKDEPTADPTGTSPP